MEFKSLTNIETSFRQIRLFALVFICLCALITGFAVGTLTASPNHNGRKYTSWITVKA